MLRTGSSSGFFLSGALLALSVLGTLSNAFPVKAPGSTAKKAAQRRNMRSLREPIPVATKKNSLANAYQAYLEAAEDHIAAESLVQERSIHQRRRLGSQEKEVPGYPGSLNAMNVSIAKIARSEYNDDWSREWKQGPPRKHPSVPVDPVQEDNPWDKSSTFHIVVPPLVTMRLAAAAFLALGVLLGPA